MPTRLLILTCSAFLTACAQAPLTVASSLTDPVPESDIAPTTPRTTALWGAENLGALREANAKLMTIGRILGHGCADDNCPQ